MADGRLDVAGCGSMVVDFFHHTPRIIGPDEKILIDAGKRHASPGRAVGGVVLNHLGWASILGLKTGIFGKIANDSNGDFLRAGMNAAGIRQHLTRDGSASSFANIFVDRQGNRAIYMTRAATGELKPAEVRERHGKFVRSAHLVTTEISQLPLPTVVAILRFAQAHSIPTVLDVDIGPADARATLGTPAQLERALHLATILKPAGAAAAELANSPTGDALEIAERMRTRYGNEAVVITEGDRGCAIAAAGTAIRVPAFKVRQIDATGAGDAFLGAMLAGIRWGMTWEKIGRLGNAAGAVCVTQLSAFPAGRDVRKRIARYFGDRLPSGPVH